MKIKNHCPICNHKLFTWHRHRSAKNNYEDYYEKTCTGYNHSFLVEINCYTKDLELMKFSLEDDYSKFLIVNFKTKKSIILLRNGEDNVSINIDQLIDVNFDKLDELKDRINKMLVYY
jgi:hypothetical protein